MTSALTKQDVARRQILAAIHLHWYLNEPLAVYTLAANAWEICDALLRHKGRSGLMSAMCETHGYRPRDIAKIINGPRNFLKHADRDPHEALTDFGIGDCEAILETACIDYMALARRTPFALGIYIIWYSAKYPNKTGSFFREAADHTFPGLAEKSEAEQREAARRVFEWARHPAIFHSAKNELTDNWRWEELRALMAMKAKAQRSN